VRKNSCRLYNMAGAETERREKRLTAGNRICLMGNNSFEMFPRIDAWYRKHEFAERSSFEGECMEL
jgi:hypothetical protein